MSTLAGAARSLLGRVLSSTTFVPSEAPPNNLNERSSNLENLGSGLCGLPGDALLYIFTFLDIEDLIACGQVCRVLYRLLRDDLRSQYKMELAFTGMADNPLSNIPMAERLAGLRAHRSRSCGPLQGYDTGEWGETENACRVLVSEGSILYSTVTPNGIDVEICHPPSRDADAETSPRRQHLLVELGADSRLEAVDFSQDLLLATEVVDHETWQLKLHALSVTTGKAHPAAATECIVDLAPQRGRPRPVQVYRQFCVWFRFTDDTYAQTLEVWNWQTGQLIWHHTFKRQVSYTFLDEDHILITRGLQEELWVYRFTEQPETEHPAQDWETGPILKLELPLGAFRASVYRDDRSRIHHSSSVANLPCYPDPMLTVFPVRFVIYDPDLATAILLVPGATLHEQIKKARASPSGTLSLFWHEWGREGGLLLKASGTGAIPRILSTAHGSRFPFLIPSKAGNGTADVIIFDLNPWAARDARRLTVNKNRIVKPDEISRRFQFDKLHANVPYVAYWGPRLSFPSRYEPTMLAMTRDGFTAVYEFNPPFQERRGVGYRTFAT